MPGPVLNLDDLRPPDVTVVFGGVEYAIPGDIPITTLIEAADLQEQLGSAPTIKEQSDVLRRMYRLVMDLFLSRNDKVPDLTLSGNEVGYIVGFVASGGDMNSLPDAIVAALAPEDEEAADGEGNEGGKRKRPPTKAKRAPARRSPQARR